MFDRPRTIPTRTSEQGPLLDVQLLDHLPDEIREQLWQLVDPRVQVLYAQDFESLLARVSAAWQRFVSDPDAPTEVLKLAGATKEQIVILEHVARGQINPVDGMELVRVLVPDVEERVWTSKAKAKPSRIPPVSSIGEMIE